VANIGVERLDGGLQGDLGPQGKLAGMAIGNVHRLFADLVSLRLQLLIGGIGEQALTTIAAQTAVLQAQFHKDLFQAGLFCLCLAPHDFDCARLGLGGGNVVDNVVLRGCSHGAAAGSGSNEKNNDRRFDTRAHMRLHEGTEYPYCEAVQFCGVINPIAARTQPLNAKIRLVW
jgi:hypothetical protein